MNILKIEYFYFKFFDKPRLLIYKKNIKKAQFVFHRFFIFNYFYDNNYEIIIFI